MRACLASRFLASPRSSAACLILASLFAACGGGDPAGPPPPPPPPQPASLAASAGGTPQAAAVGTAVPAAPAVRVTSTAGQPIAGVAVTFAATAGGGTLGATSATTGADGVASVGSWTLGTTAGANAVRATVGSLAPVTFEATGKAGPPHALAYVGGSEQEGEVTQTLATPVVVRVTDAHGNVVPDASVVFVVIQGGGTMTPRAATTDAAGEARANWTLGDAAGANVVRAELTGVAGATWTFTATAMQTLLDDVIAIDVGTSAACALKSNGSISCWGGNHDREIGDGTNVSREIATPVLAPGVSFHQVSNGLGFVCALAMSGPSFCWGRNNVGNLGVGSDLSIRTRDAPTAILGGNNYRMISAGGWHTCAIDLTDRAWCWGSNGQHEIDPTATNWYGSPTRVEFETFGSIATGGDHTCGITTAGETYCWGRAADGQLGNGDSTGTNGPHLVLGGHAFRQLAAGRDFTCGLITDGTAYCWGSNAYGQLGDGTTTPRARPAIVAAGIRFDTIETKEYNVCGVASGVAYCWGFNREGQLGNGQTSPDATPTPQRVVTPAGMKWISVHPDRQTCGLTQSGEVYCWGLNALGSLGDGTTSSVTPVRVRGR